MRKFPAEDLIMIYAKQNTKMWNEFLTKCDRSNDINALMKKLYGIQAGMDDLVTGKLNTEEMQLFFIRLQRSIENTAKKIIRRKFPNPCDNPLTAGDHLDHLEAKRLRDTYLSEFIRKSSY